MEENKNLNEDLIEETMETEETSEFINEPDYIKEISSELWLKENQIQVVLEMIAEGATVPFIARYRKEKTGNLDEDQIREIVSTKKKIENLYKAKVTAINGINSQDKLTPELLENILKSKTLKQVEEIYKPYKSKKKTKAMIALEKGFWVVAEEIKKNKPDFSIDESLLKDYSKEEIIEWVKDIIAAEVSANIDLREDLLETIKKYNSITSKIKTEKSLEKLNDKDKKQIPKFDLYKEFSARISYLKPYQILALNRWEKLSILNVSIEKTDKTYEGIAFHYARILKTKYPFITELEEAFKLWFDALFSSVSNELRSMLSDLAEDDAIDTFRKNLSALLMTKPEYGKSILAIDPWFAAGCKVAVIDEIGKPLVFDKIFLHKSNEAKSKLQNLLSKYSPKVIVVWNGTWVNETIKLLWDCLSELDSESKEKFPETYIVNESWASVYSASKVAAEEFPDLDSLDRGTISIARRYIDPLSELVKVPVWSIGVGMYQHDMHQKKLEEKLWFVVEDTVNLVGINVNTASSYVLNYISGIDKRAAKKIYNNRPYKSRKDLKKQLSDKVYEQAAWFLRVPESTDKFDNTDIHPEQYDLAKYVIENNLSKNDFAKNKEQITSLYKDANEDTIEFILSSYNQIGEEKRVNSTHQKAKLWTENIEIKEGDIVDWVVRNVLAFGAFVDIGTINDGLVHISQITDRFISDPKEVLEVWQRVKVKVTSIDENTGKIQLSMKGMN